MFHPSKVARGLGLGVVALTSAAMVAACGGGASADRGAGDVDQAGVSEAEKIVATYREPPRWLGPDAPVPVSGLEGKRVTYISASNSIPVLKYWSDVITKS